MAIGGAQSARHREGREGGVGVACDLGTRESARECEGAECLPEQCRGEGGGLFLDLLHFL